MPGAARISSNVDGVSGPALHRDNRGLLQFLERPALRWLAPRMPAWVCPDMLTGLGFAGAVVAAIGYASAAADPIMLWLASFGILLNWFGDSLDGSLARARGIERPAYGFFLDNTTDVLEYGLFAVGFGLSGYLPWWLVMAALAAFYMVMLLSLIKAQATGVFQIAFGGMGLTEVRFAFIMINGLIYFIPPRFVVVAGVTVTYPYLIAATWIATQVATFMIGMIQTLRILSVRDPAPATVRTAYGAAGKQQHPGASP